ncbi:thioredoxin domain-containing protein 11 [Ctenodactylus gundi]
MSECGGRGGGGSSSSSDDAEDEGGGGGGGPAGSCSDSPAPAGESPAGRLRRGLRCASLMARRRPELLCGAVALGCALLLALKFTCSRAKDVIIPAKPPVSFFSARSPVLDLFQGQLDYAERIRRDSEVVLLFFYAPWCGQSIAARAEIEHAASRLSDQVLFVAINCWWHQGKCRKQKHFFYFPVIHLYHRSFGPIEYKGPLSAVYIEKFVRRVMKPLLYIPSESELLDFLSDYEPGVLGYFEFRGTPPPPGYLTFFTSALHSLKKDYLGTVRFGVITNKHLAKLVSLVHSGSVYLHRHFNTSLVFPTEVMNFTAENIYRWASDNREVLLRWLRPHGGKSLLLNNELKKGPALLLFIPFDPLAERHPLIDKITEVALEYNNCHGDQVVERLLQHLRQVDAPALQSLAPELQAPQLPEVPPGAASPSPCCNTVVLPLGHAFSRTHNVCELCVNQSAGGVRLDSVSVPQCSFFEMAAALDSFYLKEQAFYHAATGTVECSNFLTSYSPFRYYTACCRTVGRGGAGLVDSTRGNSFGTPAAAFSLEQKWEAAPSAIPHIEENPHLLLDAGVTRRTFAGLSCRTNKTLNMYLLDSSLFWLYAERLGAPSSTRVKEFAAIVDVKEECHYILDPKQALVTLTLESFIQNFSVLYSPLKRHLIGSDSAKFPSQHLITEVTTDSFWEVILQKQDALLLYYAPWCGFCPSLNHVFIQLARLLPADRFTVARIDVSQNDLPWEFMVDRLPTILFFPCNRKDLSVKYPEDLPITLPNLLRFILQHSDPVSSHGSLAHAPSQGCRQSEATLQQGHISHLEREIQKLRAEISSLHRAQAQVEGQLSSARRDERRLRQQQQALEQRHSLLQQHSEQLQASYAQKARELEELADASETLLTENAWLKVLVASMERKLQGQDRAEDPDTSGEAHPDHLEPAGAPHLPASAPPPPNASSPLAADRKGENRTDSLEMT